MSWKISENQVGKRVGNKAKSEHPFGAHGYTVTKTQLAPYVGRWGEIHTNEQALTSLFPKLFQAQDQHPMWVLSRTDQTSNEWSKYPIETKHNHLLLQEKKNK